MCHSMENLIKIVILMFLAWAAAWSIGWIDNVKNVRRGRSKAIGWIILIIVALIIANTM